MILYLKISTILSFCFLSFIAYPQSEGLPKITIAGNNFATENGEKIVFHGLNSSDPDKLESDGQWNQKYFDELKSWGANLVRFPVHPKAWRERGQTAYIALLDAGIQMAENAGLYVILDWHSIGNLRTGIFHHERYHTTLSETYNFWKLMAERYGDNSTVAFFELFNEPTLNNYKFGQLSWDEWKKIMEELILIVRANGAKNIPLVAGFDWAYDLKPVRYNPIEAESIAYVSHPYPQKRNKPWEPKWQEDWGFVAETYPVILTEIGFCEEGEPGAHIPVIDDGSYVRAITDFTQSRGISYVVWVFDPNWSPMMIEDWNFTPTKAGKVWKDVMK